MVGDNSTARTTSILWSLISRLPSRSFIFKWIGGALGGLAIVLNQCGQSLATLYPSIANYDALSAFWRVNYKVATPSGQTGLTVSIIVVGVLLTFVCLVVLTGALRNAFAVGVGAGIMVLPAYVLAIIAIPVALAIIAGIAYLIYLFLDYVIFPLIKILGLAGLWVWNFLLVPVLSVIAIPFMWIWNNILIPIFEVFGEGFLWVWNFVISPVIGFLATIATWLWDYIFYYILWFVFGVVVLWAFLAVICIAAACLVTLLVLGALGIIWRVVLEGFKSSFSGNFAPQTAFGCGVGVGLFTSELTLYYALDILNVLPFFPSISQFFLLIAPVAFAVRSVAARRSIPPKFQERRFFDYLDVYWKTSRLEQYVYAIIVPVGLVISLRADAESGTQA